MKPGISKISVLLTGYQILPPPANGVTNLKMHLLLATDWQSGAANYEYLDKSGWHKVANAMVKRINTVIV